MRYVAGVDGGGSKTRFVIAGEDGRVLSDVSAGPSNHQIVGIQETEAVLRGLYEAALMKAGIPEKDIALIYLGLAGTDLEGDFEILGETAKRVFGEIPTVLANDTWPILRSGTPGSWGAAVICGSGSNAAAVRPDGERHILRALGYTLGGAGGGFEIAITALHWTFRSDEGTAERSLLPDRLPAVLGLSGMKDLLGKLYPINALEPSELTLITPLVFQLANEGDSLCQKILIEAGTELGEMLGGVLKQLGMEQMPVPVVLGGRVMGGNNPLMKDQLITTVHRTAPLARFLFPKIAPVGGAILLALEQLGVETEPDIHEKLIVPLGLDNSDCK